MHVHHILFCPLHLAHLSLLCAVRYPAGHARNTTADLEDILQRKFALLGALALDDVDSALAHLRELPKKSSEEIAALYQTLSFKLGEQVD
jgi:hypothetical protein